jgi:DNA repair protein RadC
MTIESLFEESDSQAIRFKIIRPVYEVLTIGDKSAEYFQDTGALTSSAEVSARFASLREETRENFLALHLDAKNKLLCLDRIAIGSLNAAIIHPREVFKSCLLSSAAALLLIHNHPSGNTSPSREDIEITGRLKEASELLGIRILDHIIIGAEGYYSFADQGLL